MAAARSPDDDLLSIAEAARELLSGSGAFRLMGDGDEAMLIIDLPSATEVSSTALHAHLKAFCADHDLKPRYLIVGGSAPKFV